MGNIEIFFSKKRAESISNASEFHKIRVRKFPLNAVKQSIEPSDFRGLMIRVSESTLRFNALWNPR